MRVRAREAARTILVLGGSSAIGVAVADHLARPRAAAVVLAGRHADRLEAAAARLRPAAQTTAPCGAIFTLSFDAEDTAHHDEVIADAVGLVGELDVVVVAFGLLGDQAADEQGGDGAVRVARTNYVGGVSASLAAVRQFRRQGHGTLVVLSSVAGERVRRANFIYGSSKAGLDAFALGLGDALAPSGVSVLVVRPGFVRTKMTEGRPAPPLTTTADAVGAATAAAFAHGRQLVWVPAALRYVFVVFRHLPRPLWRRLPS